jgi:hypothetical protein
MRGECGKGWGMERWRGGVVLAIADQGRNDEYTWQKTSGEPFFFTWWFVLGLGMAVCV